MAYTQTVWKNGEFPPIDAEHLNKIEQGIANSAPGGFGIGTRSKWLTNADDLNNIYQGGFYFWYGDNIPANAPDGIAYGGMIVMSRSATEFVQQVFNITDISSLQNCMLVRTAYNNTWYPWEWINPPMELGVEYRTTERYLGKPVYTKVVEGSFSGAGVTNINHGIANIDKCVAATGIALQKDSSYNFSFPYWFTNGSTLTQGLSVSINTSSIALNSVTNYAETFSVQVTIKYTKTTD